MRPTEAEALAERILAAIPTWLGGPDHLFHAQKADRNRVASDLRAYRRADEGLRDHSVVVDGTCAICHLDAAPCPDDRRYTEARDDALAGLKRSAALYGVTP